MLTSSEITANKYPCFPCGVRICLIFNCIESPSCPRNRSVEYPVPAPESLRGGDQAAQDEKKGSGNAAVADLPRHPLPLRRHLRHLHPRRRRLLLQVHRTRQAAVGVAPQVVIPEVNPESILRKGKRRNSPKKKGRKRSGINVKRRRNRKEKKTLDLFRSPST